MIGRFKSFIAGAVIGGVIAFFMGVNVGHNAPVFSNPLERNYVAQTARDHAATFFDRARAKIHDATRRD